MKLTKDQQALAHSIIDAGWWYVIVDGCHLPIEPDVLMVLGFSNGSPVPEATYNAMIYSDIYVDQIRYALMHGLPIHCLRP